MTTKRSDPVKVWFFIVLVALIPTTALFIWAINNQGYLNG
jgi:hypothetical protein